MKRGRRKVKCSYCNHIQYSKSQLKYISCSNCRNKFKVEEEPNIILDEPLEKIREVKTFNKVKLD